MKWTLPFATIVALAKTCWADEEFSSVAEAMAAGAEVALECPGWDGIVCDSEDDDAKDSLVQLTEDMILLKHEQLYGPGGTAHDNRRNLRPPERHLCPAHCKWEWDLVCASFCGLRCLDSNRKLDGMEIMSTTDTLKNMLIDVNLPLTAEQDACAQLFTCTMEWVTFDN